MFLLRCSIMGVGQSLLLGRLTLIHLQGMGTGTDCLAHAEILIHPPARGGTGSGKPWADPPEISIHPPARGGTDGHLWETASGDISIHPPARGGTCTLPSVVSSLPSFQSTHPQGVGPTNRQMTPKEEAFQSTHPQGVGLRYLQS